MAYYNGTTWVSQTPNSGTKTGDTIQKNDGTTLVATKTSNTNGTTTKTSTTWNPVVAPGVTENSVGGGTGSGYYSGSGSSSSSSSTGTDWATALANAGSSNDTLLNKKAADTTKNLFKNAGIDLNGEVDIGKVDKVSTAEQEALLLQLKEAQEKQAKLSAQNTIDTGVKTAQRAQQDAQKEYQTTKNQIDRDERRAMDNQVLYAQARGDNGGIGQAQYNSIQNTAATNRMTVQNEQTKLATDTARQIADLRAQGEFEKANQLLTISQNYLSQLMSLKQWADETNVGIEEFNIQVDEWKENYKVSLLDAQINVANATGAFADGTPTYTAYANRQSQLASIGNTLLQAGVAPTTDMLNAMGMNSSQAISYLNRYYPGGAT